MWPGLCLPAGVQLPGRLTPELTAALVNLRAEAVHWAGQRTPTPEMAEEVVQQALMRAMVYLPQLRNPQRLRPWFYQILRHVLADELQRQQRWLLVPEVAPDSLVSEGEEASGCACILQLLERLPPEDVALLRAADLQAQPVKQLAENLGLTPNATSVRLYRARRALRRQLEATCGTTSYQTCQNCDCPESSAGAADASISR